MNLYENVFIGRQDLSQQQIEALGVSLSLFITQHGGDVVRSEYCGLRGLAYPIKKNHKG
ncbi:MAG: 30S ribosomal protein S6, partial [Holosporaceae bacterium]|nr:30S ribosomal protein S6 [Holosporaceae bacterium]